MRVFDKMAGSKNATYHHILVANFDDFQKKASMLPKVFIYQIIHGSG